MRFGRLQDLGRMAASIFSTIRLLELSGPCHMQLESGMRLLVEPLARDEQHDRMPFFHVITSADLVCRPDVTPGPGSYAAAVKRKAKGCV